jgi:micrococcal nuclease
MAEIAVDFMAFMLPFRAQARLKDTLWRVGAHLFLQAFFLCFLGNVFSPALAEDGLSKTNETGRVGVVIDGDTLVLDDGREIRLVGIQAPKLPLKRKGFVSWPLAEEAKKALETLALGQNVDLRYGGQKTDRYERRLAHVFVDGNVWVQGALLAQGLARVYTFPDNRMLSEKMYAQEALARKNHRGIWSDPFYRILSPAETFDRPGTFQIVEGTPVDVAKIKGRVYLNYGADWRQDFTLVIQPKALSLFTSKNIDPLDFKGRNIRARGWLKRFNGPMINITHPEQIEAR